MKSIEELFSKIQVDMQYGHLYPNKRPKPQGYTKKSKSLYFIGCGDLVKIGVSKRPEVRMTRLFGQSPYQSPLTLIASFENLGHMETEIHHKFSHLRTLNEWFRYTNEIHEFIQELKNAENI